MDEVPNVICTPRQILRAIGWMRHVAYVVAGQKNLRERDYLEDLDVDGRIILKDPRSGIGGSKLDLSGSRYGPVTGLL
jgi:hypothetical protein